MSVFHLNIIEQSTPFLKHTEPHSFTMDDSVIFMDIKETAVVQVLLWHLGLVLDIE
jgi:hypothetical protein